MEVIKATVLLSLTILFISCSNDENRNPESNKIDTLEQTISVEPGKKELILLAQDILTWTNSSDFYAKIKRSMYSETDYSGFISDAYYKFSQKHGFTSRDQLARIMKSYRNDPDLIRLGKTFREQIVLTENQIRKAAAEAQRIRDSIENAGQ